jgi:hypothetical protein
MDDDATSAMATAASALATLPISPQPGSVRLLKQRSLGRARLFAFTLNDLSGCEWFWLAGVERDRGGWLPSGAAGAHIRSKTSDARPVLSAWSTPRASYAGARTGEMEGTLLRLAFANGVVLTDEATSGVVLFLTDRRLLLPATISS